MRERLIELMKEVKFKPFREGGGLDVSVKHQLPEHAFEAIADHLLSEGVIVPPVKVGQTVYVVGFASEEIVKRKVTEIRQNEWGTVYIHSFGFGYSERLLGKTVFLTREEAEKALAERSKE